MPALNFIRFFPHLSYNFAFMRANININIPNLGKEILARPDLFENLFVPWQPKKQQKSDDKKEHIEKCCKNITSGNASKESDNGFDYCTG